MPERARIFLAARDPRFIAEIQASLEKGRHTLDIAVFTRAAALCAIDNLGSSGITTAIVADSLTRFKDSTRGKRDLVRTLKKIVPDVKVIVFSAEEIVEANATILPSNLPSL